MPKYYTSPPFCLFRYASEIFATLFCPKFKAQGTSDHAGYFFARYGYFPYPDVTGMVYKDPDIRKFDLF